MPVYVLHLVPPYKHARHYVGYVNDKNKLDERIQHHRKGLGAKLLKAAFAAGCEVKLAYFWRSAPRQFERLIKRRKDVCLWCYHCNINTRKRPTISRMRRGK